MRLEIEIRDKSLTAASGEKLTVLRDLRIALAKGRIGAIVGPSGCGKTTLLRIVAGLDPAYDGTLRLPAGHRLGMVFQEPRLLPWRTVEQNIRLSAPDVTDDTLARLFGMLTLDAHRRHFPGELSLGLARRVALARAFAVEPDLLLLDEPFVSLDAALAAQLRLELAALMATRPVTAILVTHDIEEAAELADTLFVLSARPARVVSEIELATPRGSRDRAEIQRIVSQVRAGGAVSES